jgi:hypothetical protein
MLYIPSWQPKDDTKDVLTEKRREPKREEYVGGGS